MVEKSVSRRKSLWSRAAEVASRTPESRNRYVDFLRALSITVVVLGHWIVAAAHVTDGELRLDTMLGISPWTQWLTWALQVMPIFFIVGGYSNGISWEAALRDGKGYALWIGARLRRLVGPLVPLLVTWSIVAVVAHRAGVHPETIRIGSQAALIPTWFLAVYIMVVITVPATYAFYRRFGAASFWTFVAAAAVTDTVAFHADLLALRWLNYAFVWLAIHQLGYLWKDGRFSARANALSLAVAGLTCLILLVTVASYPISMITVPDDAVSNSRPPTLAMLAIGIFQGGLVLALEGPFRRWLRRSVPWTATVLVNGMIMTLYLWHLTSMIAFIGLAHLFGDFGLAVRPGSWSWWASRPIWIGIYAAGLVVLVGFFARFEQTAREGAAASVSLFRAMAGAAGVCAGVAMLALHGIGAPGSLGLRIVPVALVLGGVALVLLPGRATSRRDPPIAVESSDSVRLK